MGLTDTPKFLNKWMNEMKALIQFNKNFIRNLSIKKTVITQGKNYKKETY